VCKIVFDVQARASLYQTRAVFAFQNTAKCKNPFPTEVCLWRPPKTQQSLVVLPDPVPLFFWLAQFNVLLVVLQSKTLPVVVRPNAPCPYLPRGQFPSNPFLVIVPSDMFRIPFLSIRPAESLRSHTIRILLPLLCLLNRACLRMPSVVFLRLLLDPFLAGVVCRP